MGWAIAEKTADGRLCRVDSGYWPLGRAPLPMGERLYRLHRHLLELVEQCPPQLMALEAAFFGKNASSALRLGEARGVVLMTAELLDLPLVEYPPATVKARVAGTGGANKEQVQHLVGLHYGIPDFVPATSDEADALAVAACALLDPGLQDADSWNSSKTEDLKRGKRGKLPPGARFQ